MIVKATYNLDIDNTFLNNSELSYEVLNLIKQQLQVYFYITPEGSYELVADSSLIIDNDQQLIVNGKIKHELS